MNVTKVARAAVAHRTPLISFLGKRTIPQNIDHSPRAHPQSPSGVLPPVFAERRTKVQQHGQQATHSATKGSIEPAAGEVFDRNQLPRRFWRTPLTAQEIEIIESGGAAAWP